MKAEETGFIESYLDGHEEAVSIVDGWIRQAAWPFRTRLGNRWDDLLQDIRLEAFRLLKSEKFRGDSSLKTYLWRVTSNACVDRVRAQRRFVWEELDETEGFDATDFRAVTTSLAVRETRDLAVKVLAKMSRECIRLWQLLFDGHSYRQMSEILGVRPGALRVRVLRCRKKAMALREEIERAERRSVETHSKFTR